MDEMAMMQGATTAKNPPKAPGATSPAVENAVAQPMPDPKEPLPPDLVASYVSVLNDAFAALAPGEEFPPVEFDPGKEPVTQLPDDVKARTIALSAFIDQFPPAKAYAFGPATALTTAKGMSDAVTNLQKLASDQKVVNALTRGAPAEEPAATDDEAAEPVPDDEPAEGEAEPTPADKAKKRGKVADQFMQ